jgi:hypothetical protein
MVILEVFVVSLCLALAIATRPVKAMLARGRRRNPR